MTFHGYTGQRDQTVAQSGFTQANTRHGATAYDQWGRRWAFEADNRNGMPCGPFQALFTAPWYPEQHPLYFLVNPKNTNELYIDLAAMYRDRTHALRAYHNEAVQWATRNKERVPAMGDYSPAIVDAVGRPPKALELIAACAQENPWILGESDVPDPRLEKFIEKTSREIEEIMENFDFSAASYAEAVGAATAANPPDAQPFPRGRFGSLEALRQAAGLPEASNSIMPELVEDAAGKVDLSDFVEPPDGSDDGHRFEIEDEVDPAAVGGKTVKPGDERVAKQAPKRPGQTPTPRSHRANANAHQQRDPGGTGRFVKAAEGAGPRPFDRNKGASMADGAAPFTGE